MAILEQVILMEERPLSPREVLREVRALGLQTGRDAAALVRRDRDGR